MLLALWWGGGMEGMCWGIRVAIRSIGMRGSGGRGSEISGELEMGSRWVWGFVLVGVNKWIDVGGCTDVYFSKSRCRLDLI